MGTGLGFVKRRNEKGGGGGGLLSLRPLMRAKTCTDPRLCAE